MASGTKWGTEVILGKPVEIHINAKGEFNADVPGAEDDADPVKSNTLDGLKEAIRKAIRRSKANILVPITLFDDDGTGRSWYQRTHGNPERGLVHCYLRGVNSRTGALLLQHEGGKKFDRASREAEVARRFTADQVDAYKALTKAADESAADLKAFLEGVQASAGDLLAEAQASVDAAAGDESSD